MTKPTLRFNSDGHFRILMISDFHGKPDFNHKLIDGIEALVDHAKPDFVMLGGDECCGVSEDIFREFITAATEPINRRGIPWAHVYGNHDCEQNITKEQQEKVYQEFPLCLSEYGPDDISGVGNYVLPVLSHEDDSVKYHLWALDSHRNFHDYIKYYNLPDDTEFILPKTFGRGKDQASPMFNQVRWYYKESVRREKEAGYKIPAVMFMHVPILEYHLTYRNPEQTDFIGHKRDSYGTSEINSGIFFACMQRGDVKGIFCGHEHHIDQQSKYCGITLACDTAVGYDMSAHDDLRGGRIIDIREDGRMETRHVKLMELMGESAMRRSDFFEGGDKYYIRAL